MACSGLLSSMLICSVISGVWCIFGLRIKDQIVGSVKSTSDWIYDPHVSITRREAEVDDSGTLGIILGMTKKLSEPIMFLMDTIHSGVRDNKMKTDRWFGFAYKYMQQSLGAIKEVNATAENLKNATKANLYNEIKNDLTSLNETGLTNLLEGLGTLYFKLKAIGEAEYQPNSGNISLYITEDIISNVTIPLEAVNTYMSSITSTLKAIASGRRQIIGHHAKLNETMNGSMRNLAKAFILFNRTIVEAEKSVIENMTLTFDIYDQSHRFILDQMNYFGTDNSSLLKISPDMAIERETSSTAVANSTNFCTSQAANHIQEQTLLVTQQLLIAMNNVTNQFAVSSLSTTESCTPEAVRQLINIAMQVNRMGSCMNSEIENVRKATTVVHKLLWNTIGGIAFATVDLLPATCPEGPDRRCIDVDYFTNNITQYARSRISTGVEQFVNGERMTCDRIVDCTTRIGRAISLYAQEIHNQFTTCLSLPGRKLSV
nr:uncharacterized protein LOC109427553 [Aedes albopictus]